MQQTFPVSFSRWLKLALAAQALACAFIAHSRPATADALQTPEQSEEAALREELQRIIKDDPEKAAAARKMLEALDEPASSPHGRELRNRRQKSTKRIVNGLFTSSHSAVAAILKGGNPEAAKATCTGTLVSCDKVLTAAHCVANNPTPANYHVFFQNLGFFNVTAINWLSKEYAFPYADLAILTLEKPVQGIAPISVNAIASPINGSMATIVGYGRTGGAREDYGIKRDGSVKFARCTMEYANKKLLCWNFDADINTTPGVSNTCNADSGGGVFMPDKEGQRTVERVVGVVSGGRDIDCVKGDRSYNTDVFQWREWIAKEIDTASYLSVCGGGPAVDGPENIRNKLVTISSAQPEAVYEISVPEGTASLRVAMNGEDSGKHANDFDLLLFKGAKGSTDKAACTRAGTGQFAYCEIPNPASGQWTVAVRQKKGEGYAQITATLLRGKSNP